MRRHYRRRRDALIAALDHQLPTLSVGGVAAGLHLTLSLPDITNWPTLRRALRDQGVDARCTDDFRAGPAATPMRLVLGYGNLTSASVEGAVRALSHGLKVSGVSS